MELACGTDERAIRDSKNPDGDMLTFPLAAAVRFLAEVRRTS